MYNVEEKGGKSYLPTFLAPLAYAMARCPSCVHPCPSYSPEVKFGPTPGVTSFTWAYIRKTLEIPLYLARRPKLTKFCM